MPTKPVVSLDESPKFEDDLDRRLSGKTRGVSSTSFAKDVDELSGKFVDLYPRASKSEPAMPDVASASSSSPSLVGVPKTSDSSATMFSAPALTIAMPSSESHEDEEEVPSPDAVPRKPDGSHEEPLVDDQATDKVRAATHSRSGHVQTKRTPQEQDAYLLSRLTRSMSINDQSAGVKLEQLESKMAFMTPNHANFVVQDVRKSDIKQRVALNTSVLRFLLNNPIVNPSVKTGPTIDQFRFWQNDMNGKPRLICLMVSKSMARGETNAGSITRHFPGLSTTLPAACLYEVSKAKDFIELQNTELQIPMLPGLPIKCFLQGISTGEYVVCPAKQFPADVKRYSELMPTIVQEDSRRAQSREDESRRRLVVKLDRPILVFIGHDGSDKLSYVDTILMYYGNVLDHQLLMDVTHLDEIRSFTQPDRDREEFVNRDFPFHSDKLAKICVFGGITVSRLIEKGVAPFPSTPVLISENRGFLDICVDAPWFEARPSPHHRQRSEPDRILLLAEATLASYQEGGRAIRVAKKRMQTGDIIQTFFFIDGDMDLMWRLIERRLERPTLMACYDAVLSIAKCVVGMSTAQITNLYIPQLRRSADYLLEDFRLTPNSPLFLNARNREVAMNELMNLHQAVEVQDGPKGGQTIVPALDRNLLEALDLTETKLNLPNVHLAQFSFKPRFVDVNPDAMFCDFQQRPIVTYRHHELLPDVPRLERNCIVLLQSPQGRFFTLPRPFGKNMVSF